VILFYNRGHRAILREHLRADVCFGLGDGQLLRIPTLLAISRAQNKVGAQDLPSDRNRFVLSFDFLDHGDGALVEVLHTTRDVTCALTLIESDPLRRTPSLNQPRFFTSVGLQRVTGWLWPGPFLLVPIAIALGVNVLVDRILSPSLTDSGLDFVGRLIPLTGLCLLFVGLGALVTSPKTRHRLLVSNPQWLETWLRDHEHD
jgi:hypothetical protein